MVCILLSFKDLAGSGMSAHFDSRLEIAAQEGKGTHKDTIK